MTTPSPAPRAVVVHSGGLDSTVLLAWARARGYDVLSLSVNYGQRHERELAHASAIADAIGVRHRLVDLHALRYALPGSALTDASVPVPHGHYEEESMKATVVPNRNMILLAVAIAVAVAEGAERVMYGAHAGDHAIYPDCRPDFYAAMQKAARLADWMPVELVAPFVQMTKAQIVETGHRLRVPFEMTWSCYEGGDVHCGKCGTCVERREAFALANVYDPTRYRADVPLDVSAIRV